MALSADEVKFFETGDASHLTSGAPETPPAADPIALSGLNNEPSSLQAETPAPAAAAPVAPAPAATPPAETEALTKLLRESLDNSQRQLVELQAKLDATKTAPAPAPAAPDPNNDPLGHLLHQVDQTNKAVQELQTKLTQEQEQSANVRKLQEFTQQVQDLKTEFVKTTPDFDAAYNHLRTARLEDLQLVGYTREQAQQQLLTEEFQVATAAIQQAKNPAELFYAMAKRHGYVPAAVPASQSAEHLKKIEAAAAASKGAALPRAADPADLTPAGLRAASEADLNRLVMDPKAWAKIAGTDEDDIFPAR